MEDDLESMTYESFEAYATEQLLQLTDDFALKIIGIFGKEDSGFDMDALHSTLTRRVNENKYTREKVTKAIHMLLRLFHLRGPNIGNLRIKNTNVRDELMGYISDLEVKSKITKGTNELTLTRLSLLFPATSMELFATNLTKINPPVSETQIGIRKSKICYPNCIPSLFEKSGVDTNGSMILIVHNIYQTHLSELTQYPPRRLCQRQKQFVAKPLHSFFDSAVNISQIDRKRPKSNPINTTRRDRADAAMNAANMDYEEVIESLYNIVKHLKPEDLSFEITTIFEAAVVVMVRDGNTNRSVLIENLKEKDFNSFKLFYKIYD